jgi:glucokinase
MILAGDIGGTNTRLAYFAQENNAVVWKLHAKYPSIDYANLEDIVSDFVGKYKVPIEHAAFGIAGVIIDGTVHATNLPWTVSSKNLSALLKSTQVHLINDLEANTWGLFTLGPKDYITLNDITENPEGNLALISAGTGLGEAGAVLLNGSLQPVASEGGHTDFAPRNSLQDSLLVYLRNEFGHVSWERVLSGTGLFNIYRFLRDTKYGEEQPWLAEELSHQDHGAVITKNALSGKSAICNEVLDIFCEIYGAEAGNLALKLTAKGGVYLGGGIAPRIANKLKTSNFLPEFTDKGRMNDYLKLIPVKVILNDNAALLGACKYAMHIAGLNKEIVFA